MWLVYLLLILDKVSGLALACVVFSAAAFIVSLIFHIVASCEDGNGRNDFSPNQKNTINKIKTIALRILIPAVIALTFIPNSKQAAIIFTAGGAIEYVQGSDKIKELPNKAVECLDKFISEYLNESADNK